SESGTFQGRYSDSGRSDRAQRSSDSSRRPGEAGRRQKGAQNSHNREGGKAYLQAGRREKQPDSIRYGGRGSYSGVESRHGAPRASGDAGHPMQAGRERNGFRSEGKDKGRYGRPGTDSR